MYLTFEGTPSDRFAVQLTKSASRLGCYALRLISYYRVNLFDHNWNDSRGGLVVQAVWRNTLHGLKHVNMCMGGFIKDILRIVPSFFYFLLSSWMPQVPSYNFVLSKFLQGHDTTATSMSFSLFLLGMHPDIQVSLIVLFFTIYL